MAKMKKIFFRERQPVAFSPPPAKNFRRQVFEVKIC